MDENCRMNEAEIAALIVEAQDIEYEEYLMTFGPRAFAPDEEGPFYWEVK